MSRPAPPCGKDALHPLGQAAEIMGRMRDNATKVNQRSRARLDFLVELSALSRGVADEVRSIETLSKEGMAALGEIGGDVERIAERVQAIVARIDEGAALSQEVAEAIDRFNADFSQIQRISQDIAAIAKQTNLLALNATIEAARAGEAGKGFAVVATEVKTLATSAARSVEEIDGILGALGRSAEAATLKVGDLTRSLDQATTETRESGAAVAAITGRVGEASGIASRTAAQASEQLAGFETIVARLDEIRADTEAAITGSATNIDLAEQALAEIEAARRSVRALAEEAAAGRGD